MTNLFGKKPESPESDKAARHAAQELFHKAEQAFPESVKVAMRLIERRPPEVDAVTGYGAPLHEAFADLVLKAIHLKRHQAGGGVQPLSHEDLPSLTPLDGERLADFGELIANARETPQELILLSFPGGEANSIRGVEAQLEFLHDPRTILILLAPEELMVRRDFLLSTAQTIAPEAAIDQVPGHLAEFCRSLAGIEETPSHLTAFGYPLDKFTAAGD